MLWLRLQRIALTPRRSMSGSSCWMGTKGGQGLLQSLLVPLFWLELLHLSTLGLGVGIRRAWRRIIRWILHWLGIHCRGASSWFCFGTKAYSPACFYEGYLEFHNTAYAGKLVEDSSQGTPANSRWPELFPALSYFYLWNIASSMHKPSSAALPCTHLDTRLAPGLYLCHCLYRLPKPHQ